MEALFVSTAIVALAEMGDKTQLLSFVLAARFKHKLPIIMGILLGKRGIIRSGRDLLNMPFWAVKEWQIL